jgi:hypothetical protein
LDISDNTISSLDEVSSLSNLPLLQQIILEGNPICFAAHYRVSFYAIFKSDVNFISYVNP